MIKIIPNTIKQQMARDLIDLMRKHGVAISLGTDGPEETGDSVSLALWAPVVERQREAQVDALPQSAIPAAGEREHSDEFDFALDVLDLALGTIERLTSVVVHIEHFERAGGSDMGQASQLAPTIAKLGGNSQRRVPTADEALELRELITAVAAAHAFDTDQTRAAIELAADHFDQSLSLYRRLAHHAGISVQPAAQGGGS